MVDNNNFPEELYTLLQSKTNYASDVLFFLDLFIRASRDNNFIFKNDRLSIIFNVLRDFKSHNGLSTNDMRDLLTSVRKKFIETPEPVLNSLQRIERQRLDAEERARQNEAREAKVAEKKAKRAEAAAAAEAVDEAADDATATAARSAAARAAGLGDRTAVARAWEAAAAKAEGWAEEEGDWLDALQSPATKGRPQQQKSRHNNIGGSKSKKNKISKKSKRLKSISLKRRNNHIRHAK